MASREQRKAIERALAHPLTPLAADLRSAFDAYQLRHYWRFLLLVNLLGQFAYMSYGLADALVLEDLGWSSLQVRLGMIGVTLPLVLALFRWCRNVRTLDLLLPCLILVAALIWYELLSRSHDPDIPTYLYASLIFIVLANLCVQVAFLPSLVVSLAISAVTLYAAWQLNQHSATALLVFTLVYLPVFLFSLFMSWSTTLDRRRAFLRALLDDLGQQALAEVNRRLQSLAHTDMLTGLGNRRYFEEQSLREIAQAWRHGTPLCLLLLDVDHFKRINDTQGHAVGDEALRVLGATLRQALRQGDVLGRFGGEEFAVLLPHTTLAEALPLAERLRHTVATRQVPLQSGAALAISVSIGVAPLLDARGDLDTLLKGADAALYRAKADGRNCVRVAGEGAGAALVD